MRRVASPTKSARLLARAISTAPPRTFQYVPSCPELRRAPRYKDDVGPREFFQKIRQHRNMWQNVLAWEDEFVGQVKEEGAIPPQMLEKLLRDLSDVCYEYTGGADAEKVRKENDLLKEKLFKNSQMYLRELNVHREALRTMPDIGEMSAEEAYLYEPIQILGEPWSSIMREVVDERVKQIICKGFHKKKEVVEDIEDIDAIKERLSQEIQDHVETKRFRELAEQALEALQQEALQQEAEETLNRLRELEEEGNQKQLELDELQARLSTLESDAATSSGEWESIKNSLQEEVESLQNMLEAERRSREELERAMSESELRWEAEVRKALADAEALGRELADTQARALADAESMGGAQKAELDLQRSRAMKAEMAEKRLKQDMERMKDELADVLRKLQEAEEASKDSRSFREALALEYEEKQRGWEAAQKKIIKKYTDELATQAARIQTLEEENGRLQRVIGSLEGRIQELENAQPPQQQKKYAGKTLKYEKSVTTFSSGKVWTRLFNDAGDKTVRLCKLQSDSHTTQKDEILRKERSSYLPTDPSWTKPPEDRRVLLEEDILGRRDDFATTLRDDGSCDSHSTVFSPRSDGEPPSPDAHSHPMSRPVSRTGPRPTSRPPSRGAYHTTVRVDGSGVPERVLYPSHGGLDATGGEDHAGRQEISCPASRGTSRPVSRGRAPRPPSLAMIASQSQTQLSTGLSRPTSGTRPMSRPASRAGPAARRAATEGDAEDNPFAAFSHIPAEALEPAKEEEVKLPHPAMPRSASAAALPSVGTNNSRAAHTSSESPCDSAKLPRGPSLGVLFSRR